MSGQAHRGYEHISWDQITRERGHPAYLGTTGRMPRVRSLAVLYCLVCLACPVGLAAASIQGTVRGPDGPLAGAIVRQQTTANFVLSDETGQFTLSGLTQGQEIAVTAWKEGYHPAAVTVTPPQTDVSLNLVKHPDQDNPDYKWITSYADPNEPVACEHCMVAFPQWRVDAHSQSAVNRRFLSLYQGTNLAGSPLGGGFADDFPGTSGSCANCHAPAAAVHQPFATYMDQLLPVEQEGVLCDFCHKIADVYLERGTGLPYSNMPGIQSFRLNRPPPDTHMFYGPFDDVPRRVARLDLEKKSQFCAPCHQFSFWGTPIYESFREWLESSYPQRGIECQGCHMIPPGVTPYFVFPEQGGKIRDPKLISSHLMPGSVDVPLLNNTVEMWVDTEWRRGEIVVRVTLKNTGAGHHVPTDFPGRQMLLVVTAEDASQQPLSLRTGPTIPSWGGAQAGKAGKVFAKILRDVQTGEKPVVTYWKQTLIDSDNRLAAEAVDVSEYRFAAPVLPPPAQVSVQLLFRRVFDNVRAQRGWDIGDVVMEESHDAVFPASIRRRPRDSGR
jgi:hypothetical protein